MVLCGSISWGVWVRSSDAALQIPQENTEIKFWKGEKLIRFSRMKSYSSTRRLKDQPPGVAHSLNTWAGCSSRSEWARTRDTDEVATNTSTSVFLKKGSSTVRMTHPGSLYTTHARELSSRLGEIGSQGKRLRNPLTNYPGESLVLQRLRGRQNWKMSTLRQWFLHHTHDTQSDAGSHS